MRLVTFEKNKQRKIGALLENQIIDFSIACKEYRIPPLPGSMREFLELGNPALSKAKKIIQSVEKDLKKSKKPKSLLSLKSVHLCSPIDTPEKIICIGQNYIDHCREQNVEPPTKP